MDIEKTLKAIADSQLRAERRMDLAERRMDLADQRADQRAALADKRMDRIDHQLRTTAILVTRGIKMVVEMKKDQAEIKRAQKEWDFKYNALVDSQMRTDEALRKTDEKFNRLMEVLIRRNGNGRK